jgi:hypothetical protein
MMPSVPRVAQANLERFLGRDEIGIVGGTERARAEPADREPARRLPFLPGL